MRWTLALALFLVPLAGCLGDDADAADDASDGATARVFSGLVEFGENTTEGSGAAAPSGFGATGLAYVSGYGPEPNIGVTSSGAVFTSAFSTVMRSLDEGATWEAVHTHELGIEDALSTNNDPMLWVDPWTDTVYSAPMFPILTCSQVYASTDDGDSWNGPTPACGTGAYDHQKFASGPPGPGANPLAGLLHPTVLYLCYNGIAVTNCMASYDGGQTWPVDQPTTANTVGFVMGVGGVPTPIAQMTDCLSGQNGHPTVGPDGTVAFLRTWSCSQPLLTYSTDSGLTWTTVAGPEFPGGPSSALDGDIHSIDPEVAFTSDGTLYAMYQGHDHHSYVARTTDLGATWEGPFDVTPPGVGSTVFAALAGGDPGRIALAFVGSQDGTGSSAEIGPKARWHLWIVTSEDADSGDPTFVAYQATPDGCSPFNECSDLPAEEQTAAFRGGAGAVAWLKGWSLLEATRTGPLPIA